MSAPVANLKCRVCERSASIRITGRANFNLAVDFNALLTDLKKQGCETFQMDLSECVLMDSTFLGVLSGFGLKFCPIDGAESNAHAVELLNANERVAELLENLGVIHLFKVTRGTAPDWQNVAEHSCETAKPSREAVTRTCLKAHETLVNINPGNEDRFKDVTKFLSEDLKRLKKDF